MTHKEATTSSRTSVHRRWQIYPTPERWVYTAECETCGWVGPTRKTEADAQVDVKYAGCLCDQVAP